MNQQTFSARSSVLITAPELGALLGVAAGESVQSLGEKPLVLDVRWQLPTSREPFDGSHLYLAGHIPGAVYVDLDTELADPPSLAGGRHPLPSPLRLQAAAQRWGLQPGQLVIAYDTIGGMGAARLWWLLRDCGFEVRILDGGLPAWLSAGLPVERGDVVPVPSAVTLTPGRLPVLELDDVAEFAQAGVLLDARGGVRYRGDLEPIDLRPGHIPGAVSAPAGHDIDAEGRFLSDSELAARFARHGIGPLAETPTGLPIAVYCGSGVTAAHEIASLAVIGVEAALFPGSYSQWVTDPSRPVALGADTRGLMASATNCVP
jgi:thiosulfate/3-mercaptopyruvate sulfurtransferase